ncbi:hypothetical protein D9619_013026 [Psilocybe cf. subviscida]|uniref:Aminoglycoside phosphotransferase domain-containing protein n=1 Tax=Psilocybe cf. subviscida TaxID=2480587 RepID=A0A8H5B175_9AGAR|nr:hypothetical protein D9619_013026 [Psilocybe cf. subviscida]
MEETNHQYTAHPVLSLSIPPKDATVFFDNWPHARKLPTPEEIRTRAFDAQYKVLNERPTSQRIFYLPDLGLVIKHGKRITIAEGQVLWAITEFCPGMRAPMVYGWCTDGGEVFMYLSYVDGAMLDSRLETLNDEELKDIAGQLAVMLNSLRRVTQPAQEVFIGTPGRGPVNDQMWWNGNYRRTFSSVKEYNQALFEFARNVPQSPQQEVFQNVRASFPNKASICLTHTDLATEISSSHPPKRR